LHRRTGGWTRRRGRARRREERVIDTATGTVTKRQERKRGRGKASAKAARRHLLRQGRRDTIHVGIPSHSTDPPSERDPAGSLPRERQEPALLQAGARRKARPAGVRGEAASEPAEAKKATGHRASRRLLGPRRGRGWAGGEKIGFGRQSVMLTARSKIKSSPKSKGRREKETAEKESAPASTWSPQAKGSMSSKNHCKSPNLQISKSPINV
jgi:hypothetical protein